MNKEKLRAFTLGARKNFKKVQVELKIDGATEFFELRQPTIGQRGEIRSKSMKFNTSEEEEVKFDMFGFLICAVVELTYVPGTDERVFSDEDYEALKGMPAGGWFDKLTKEASALCNVQENSEEVKKPSEGTQKNNESTE